MVLAFLVVLPEILIYSKLESFFTYITVQHICSTYMCVFVISEHVCKLHLFLIKCHLNVDKKEFTHSCSLLRYFGSVFYDPVYYHFQLHVV